MAHALPTDQRLAHVEEARCPADGSGLLDGLPVVGFRVSFPPTAEAATTRHVEYFRAVLAGEPRRFGRVKPPFRNLPVRAVLGLWLRKVLLQPLWKLQPHFFGGALHIRMAVCLVAAVHEALLLSAVAEPPHEARNVAAASEVVGSEGVAQVLQANAVLVPVFRSEPSGLPGLSPPVVELPFAEVKCPFFGASAFEKGFERIHRDRGKINPRAPLACLVISYEKRPIIFVNIPPSDAQDGRLIDAS